jgi:hypothetical protein
MLIVPLDSAPDVTKPAALEVVAMPVVPTVVLDPSGVPKMDVVASGVGVNGEVVVSGVVNGVVPGGAVVRGKVDVVVLAVVPSVVKPRPDPTLERLLSEPVPMGAAPGLPTLLRWAKAGAANARATIETRAKRADDIMAASPENRLIQSKQPSDPNCSRINSRCPPTKPQSPARATRIAVSSVALSDSGCSSASPSMTLSSFWTWKIGRLSGSPLFGRSPSSANLRPRPMAAFHLFRPKAAGPLPAPSSLEANVCYLCTET